MRFLAFWAVAGWLGLYVACTPGEAAVDSVATGLQATSDTTTYCRVQAELAPDGGAMRAYCACVADAGLACEPEVVTCLRDGGAWTNTGCEVRDGSR